MTYDLVIRGATVVRPEGRLEADVAVHGGRIERVEPDVARDGRLEVDARGHLLLPGLIDPHVHLRTPGGTHKEDFHSGTLAAASGGITTVLDMPNTSPPTTDRQRLEEKRQQARAMSVVDFGLFLGATADNLEELRAAEETENFAAIKIYMGSSTGPLMLSDEDRLRCFFRHTRKLISVHAEDESTIRERTEALKTEGRRPAHGEVRPPEAAAKAVALAVALASENLHPLHICHVSTGVELGIVTQVPPDLVTVEVAPHHLLLNESAEEMLDTYVKVNPPLRSELDRRQLWEAVRQGRVQALATDHAPHTRREKEQDYWSAPSGIPGLDTSLITLLHAVKMGWLSLEQLVGIAAAGPARIFGIQNKGRIDEGFDADLVQLSRAAARPLSEADLYSRSGWSPFTGWVLPPKPAKVWVRGVQVVEEGRVIQADHRGLEVRFAEPLPSSGHGGCGCGHHAHPE